MKVSLVVAAGVHEGRVIPITGPQFLIGRDQQCHLRPASQAISKQHCAVLVRDGQVYIQDFGSTNGTLVNDELIQNKEVAVVDGASLRIGPLDFRVRIEKVEAKQDGTPLPAHSPETAAALAAVKAATAAAAAAKAPVRDTTPAPMLPGDQPAKGTVPTKLDGAQETPALNATPSDLTTDEDQDRIAAMLLGMDEAGNSDVPDGSTVMEIPSPLAGNQGTGDKDKKNEKKSATQTSEEMSNAASDLLRKYMRRPK
ncbi:MAG: FHA domain-containing protein [Planctomycetia bacterium]|nr:FHA domain-containing protein [Planctomycetia bacterium]